MDSTPNAGPLFDNSINIKKKEERCNDDGNNDNNIIKRRRARETVYARSKLHRVIHKYMTRNHCRVRDTRNSGHCGRRGQNGNNIVFLW